MNPSRPIAGLFPKAFFCFALLLLACHLGQDAKQENTLTFSKHFDSLSKYDSLVIEVKDVEGNLLDVIFEGKATHGSQLEKLDVAGWSGGPIRIIISGYRKGGSEPIYREEKHYDGKTRKTDTILVHLHPNIGISAPNLSVRIQEGRKAPLPRVDITPANLADAGLTWSSANTGIVAVEGNALAGISSGFALVTARLGRDTTKALVFSVQVEKSVTDNQVVTIEAPADNSYTNRRRIQVQWSVNGNAQEDLLTEDLATVGPNVIIRSMTDSSGKTHTASITVHLDTTAPQKPVLSGASPTNTRPRWIWSTGGGGGSGDFRFRVGDADFAADSLTTRETAYTLASDPASGTTYTLYVQERDLAGNWSPIASLGILHDVTRPVVRITIPQASGIHYTSSSGTILSGTATGPLPISRVTYRIASGTANNATYSAGAWSTSPISLQEGSYLQITVTAIDNAGNSGDALLDLFLDKTPPTAPTFSTTPPAATTSLKAAFGWNPGGDGSSGSGLNGRYRYNLNDGPWKDTTANLLAGLPLVEGNNIFRVQAQDRAQLWSASATHTVRVDTTAPIISLSSHANPAASPSRSITLSGQVQDSGTGVAIMTVSGQASGSSTVIVSGNTWTAASLTLEPGPNTLVFTATDPLGNSRNLTVTVNVNIPAPRIIITNPSDSLTLTRLDTIRVHYTLDGIPGNQRFNLVEGVNRLEVTSPPNESGNIGRDTVKVTRDAIPPRAPNLTAGTTPTNASATWTWTSRGDSANGAGVRIPAVFRYAVNGGSFVETGSNQHQIAEEGSYSLLVQEQDRAGNWSPSSAARSIVVDKSGPDIQIQTRNNYVTNRPRVYVRYTVDGVPTGPSVCPLSNTDTSHTCPVSAVDNLGNRTNASITVWYRPNTWFVTQDGNGPGTSWDSASSDLAELAGNDSLPIKELWVANGNYSVIGSSFVKILGGFDAAVHPNHARNRNLIGTVVEASSVGQNFSADGIVFGTIFINGGQATLNNVTISPPDAGTGEITDRGVGVYFGGSLVANNLVISNETFGTSTISIENSTAIFSGGSVVNNVSEWIFSISSSSQVTFTNGFNLYGNTSTGAGTVQLSISNSQLNVETGVNFDCSSIMKGENVSGACKGNPY